MDFSNKSLVYCLINKVGVISWKNNRFYTNNVNTKESRKGYQTIIY